MRLRHFVSGVAAVALGALVCAGGASAQSAFYSQGFETDTSGWYNYGDGTITRQHSGYTNGGGYADGINSAAGSYHARLDVTTSSSCKPGVDKSLGSSGCPGPYTVWGTDPSSNGAPVPAGGSVTQLAIYLDVNFAAAHSDYRFDWDSALIDSNGNFLQDYIFNGGTANSSLPAGCDPLPTGNAYFVISASNNSQRGSAYPQNPDKTPQCITVSGWYTFRHTFKPDGGGNLEVDMEILDSAGAVVAKWVMQPAVPFTAVGYNAYGWFSAQEINDLAIDNTVLRPRVPQTTDDCKNGNWQLFSSPSFKNQGVCVASVVSQSANH